MQKSFWWWQCSDRYIISLSPHLHTLFSPSLISLMVFVDVKHHVYMMKKQLAGSGGGGREGCWCLFGMPLWGAVWWEALGGGQDPSLLQVCFGWLPPLTSGQVMFWRCFLPGAPAAGIRQQMSCTLNFMQDADVFVVDLVACWSLSHDYYRIVNFHFYSFLKHCWKWKTFMTHQNQMNESKTKQQKDHKKTNQPTNNNNTTTTTKTTTTTTKQEQKTLFYARCSQSYTFLFLSPSSVARVSSVSALLDFMSVEMRGTVNNIALVLHVFVTSCCLFCFW